MDPIDINEIVGLLKGSTNRGVNVVSQYLPGQLSFSDAFTWDAVPIIAFSTGLHLYNKYIDYKKYMEKEKDKWEQNKDFWSAFLSSDFIKKQRVSVGERRREGGKVSNFDTEGCIHASAFPYNSFIDYATKDVKDDEQHIKGGKIFEELYSFNVSSVTLLTLKGLINLSANLFSKTNTIAVGGWIPHDDSYSILMRMQNKLPYEFRIKGREEKTVTSEEVKRIRKSIEDNKGSILDGKKVEWLIYDKNNEEILVNPQRFSEENQSMKEDGAIIIYTEHPTEEREVLAFMGARASASAVSPLLLTMMHSNNQYGSPFRKIYNNKEKYKSEIGDTKYWSMALKFEFEEYEWRKVPGEDKIKNIEVKGPMLPLG